MTALNITQDVGPTLQANLAKLEQLDSIESVVKKILDGSQLRSQELREMNPKASRFPNNSEDLKEGINLTGKVTETQKLWRRRMNSMKLNEQS